MCHDPRSRPPAPPFVTDLDSTGFLELTAADGNVLAAYEAIGAGTPRARLVVLPDVRGLHPYYQALAEEFAQAGVWTVVIDYFGRTAGAHPRDDTFEFGPHVAQLTPEQVDLDVAAAVRHLSGEGTHPVHTLGFCFGGGHSWRLAASEVPLAGVIGLYGRPSLVAEVADAVHAPLLMLVAGADHAIPAQDSLDVADRLRAAGKDVDVHVYEGAPHSFFDRSFADHADACADAWRRMLAFLGAAGEPAEPADDVTVPAAP